ncbi:MAG TPA: hypothetical protein ENK46_03720 [Flavobacteriia bacterium]|nr:hypothetical protein [Flavobacteriia bacterium]
MKKIAFLFFYFISLTIFAQTDSQTKFWEHVRYGGGLGFSFGSNYTTIAIAPSAIYEFNDSFALGLGTSYLYAKNNDLKSNVYGASIISLYNPLEEFQLSAEFEQLFVNQKLGFEKNNYNYPALYIGAAYRIGSFAAGLRYDVLYDDKKSIFASAFSPIVRFYF